MDNTTPSSPTTLSDAPPSAGVKPFPTSSDAERVTRASDGSNPSAQGASSASPEDNVAPAASMAERLIQRATTGAHGAVEGASAKARQLTGGLQGGVGTLTEKRDEWIESTREAIRQHPFAAIGTAVLLGLALRSLSSSRDR